MRSRFGAEIRSSVCPGHVKFEMLIKSRRLLEMLSSELGREVEAGDRRMAAIEEDLQRTGWKRRRRESSRAKTATF